MFSHEERINFIKPFLDNTAPLSKYTELGILKFGKALFKEELSSPYAELHWEMCQLFASMNHPGKTTSIERGSYFLVHREAAKSTIAVFLFPMYMICMYGLPVKFRLYDVKKYGVDTPRDEFGNFTSVPVGVTRTEEFDEWTIQDYKERFIVLAAETRQMAIVKVTNLKSVLDANLLIPQLFGEKKPEMLQLVEENNRKAKSKWTQDSFVTSDKTVVLGLGAGQAVRGINYFGNRPSFIIVDDMYSRSNTKTESSREHLNNWFFAELGNSSDSQRGKMLWLGTMVHPDTVITKMQDSANYYGIERPIIATEDLHRAIAEYPSDTLSKKKNEIIINQTKYKTLSWPGRHTLFYVLSQYYEYLRRQNLNYFYQEYMNTSIAPEDKMLNKDALVLTQITYTERNNKSYVSFMLENRRWHGEVALYAGIDPASSMATTSDDTVIVVAGLVRAYPDLPGYDTASIRRDFRDGVLMPVILHMEGGKYAIHNHNKLPGMCEAIVALDKKFKMKVIKFEANGQQLQIAREIEMALRHGINTVHINDNKRMDNKVTPSDRMTVFQAEYNNEKKEERILSVILPLAQRYKYIICDMQVKPKLEKFYEQILTLGIGNHDDYADAFAIAMKDILPPPISYEFMDNPDEEGGESRLDILRREFGNDAKYYL